MGNGNGESVRDAVARRRGGQRQGQDQPAGEVDTWDRKAYALVAGWKPQIGQALARQHDSEHFLRMAALGLASSRQAGQLAKCSRESLYNAVMQCAHYGLLPDGVHAAVVPYGTTATFVPMYQGFVQLAFNTGQVRSVTAKLIYQRDLYDIEYGPAGRGFIHKPVLFTEDGQAVARGRLGADAKPLDGPGRDNPPILAYAYATFRDGTSTEVEIVTKQEAIETRDKHSKAYQNAERGWGGKPPKRDSFWHTDFDKAWLKTAVRRAMKYIPKSAQLVELLLADQAADSTIPGQRQPWAPPALPAGGDPGEFTPGGPAAAWEGDVAHGDGSVIPGTVERQPLDRAGAQRWLHAQFSDAGLGGEDGHSVRVAVCRVLGRAADADPLLAITSTSQMDEAQSQRAAQRLADLIAGWAEGGADPAGQLTTMARAVADMADTAGRPAPGGGQGRRRAAPGAGSGGEATPAPAPPGEEQ